MKATVGIMMFALSCLSLDAARRVPGPPDPEIPGRIAAALSETAHVSVSYWDRAAKKEKFFAVTDKTWIERFRELLGKADYQPSGHLLAIGPPVEFFDKNGHSLLKLQIFESTVRLESRDYEGGKPSCDALHALIEEQKANHAPQTTPVSAPR